ncbi:MAG: sensor histidine kinase [Floccifex sp.]
MNHVIELIYNAIEAILITGFIAMYFETINRFSTKIDILISFILIFSLDTIISIIDVSWIIVMILFIPLLTLITKTFYQGSLLEHLLISIIVALLLALTDACIFTLMSKILGVEYSDLVTKSNIARFLTVMLSKVIYLFAASVIISFKRKYAMIFHSAELIMMSVTFVISCILITIVRNIIFNTKDYYNAFLIILICLLLLNIVQYYVMIYISKKNIIEKNITLMQKQIEMQKDSIRILEQKYDETAKIRHDMKNYISCALNLAEQENNSELINYLKELSNNKIDMITSYIKTNRKILSAVLNSKLGIALQKGFDMQCIILDELDNVADVDAGILLANLLDNAIEACERNMNSSEILLKTWSDAGYYCIEISNTVEDNVLADNPDLLTNKSDKSLHGIGLRSVKDIVEKYGGIINFAQKSNKFYVYVSLGKSVS